jgi:succinyl-diaminopimelate desuccinylase
VEEALKSTIAKLEDQMTQTLSDMIKIPAISPASGGGGEGKRADFLQGILSAWGMECKRYEYTDEHGMKRPNLVVRYGKGPRTIWIVPHMDTVSEGDRKLWDSDPFGGKIKDGRVYGRGSSDDGQDVIAAMYALKAVKDSRIATRFSFGLAIVADEEIGSNYGIQMLLKEQNLFKEGDLVLVPDFCVADGTAIEVAEKSLLWLRITTIGVQIHASTPEKGINAAYHSSVFASQLCDSFSREFSGVDELFEPQSSTFALTKREQNVESINIIPGSDVSYIDCRILPKYDLDKVLDFGRKRARAYCKGFPGLRIDVEGFLKEDAGPPTRFDSEISAIVGRSVFSVLGKKARFIGIGGSTCAAYFRKAGFDSVVWSRNDSSIAHTPNEYCDIENMKTDFKVFSSLFEVSGVDAPKSPFRRVKEKI